MRTRVALSMLVLTAYASPVVAEALRGLPAPARVRAVSVVRATPEGTEPDLPRFRRIVGSARVIARSAPSDTGRPYVPWCAGTFTTARGIWRFVLFYGGRGDLITPGGARLRIRFDAGLSPEVPQSPRAP